MKKLLLMIILSTGYAMADTNITLPITETFTTDFGNFDCYVESASVVENGSMHVLPDFGCYLNMLSFAETNSRLTFDIMTDIDEEDIIQFFNGDNCFHIRKDYAVGGVANWELREFVGSVSDINTGIFAWRSTPQQNPWYRFIVDIEPNATNYLQFNLSIINISGDGTTVYSSPKIDSPCSTMDFLGIVPGRFSGIYIDNVSWVEPIPIATPEPELPGGGAAGAGTSYKIMPEEVRESITEQVSGLTDPQKMIAVFVISLIIWQSLIKYKVLT